MRIQHTNISALSPIAAVTPVRGSRAAAAGAVNDVNASTVVVSPQAQSLVQATQRSGEAHRAHVESLKAQVQGGTYSVDKQKLAERITDDELARSGSR